jgi:hypothetical protein
MKVQAIRKEVEALRETETTKEEENDLAVEKEIEETSEKEIEEATGKEKETEETTEKEKETEEATEIATDDQVQAVALVMKVQAEEENVVLGEIEEDLQKTKKME